MTINKIKTQSTNWENIQNTYLTKNWWTILRCLEREKYEQNILYKNLIKDRRLEYIIHLEYWNCSKQPINNWQQILSIHSTKQESQIPNKHIKYAQYNFWSWKYNLKSQKISQEVL